MADTSFNRNAQTETNPAPAVPANTQTTLAAPTAVGKVSGYVDRKDFIVPSLKIVNGSGDLAEKFERGELILNNEEKLSDGTSPIKLTVLNIKTFFTEKLTDKDRKEGKTPRNFETPEQVAAAGGHLEWVNDEPPPFMKVADALVAIERDTEHPLFPFGYDGKYYAVAQWGLRSSSGYNRAAKLIITAANWGLKDGLQNGSWFLSTKPEKISGYTVAVPVLKSGPRNTAEVAAFLASLV